MAKPLFISGGSSVGQLDLGATPGPNHLPAGVRKHFSPEPIPLSSDRGVATSVTHGSERDTGWLLHKPGTLGRRGCASHVFDQPIQMDE
jgi:hypothetical protein